MIINEVKTTKLSILDKVEYKSATFINKVFPSHFHQNWSLAYIQSGSENVSFNGFDFLLHKNALVLIPPFSVHKNWGSKNNPWAYKALYLNIDLVKSVALKLKIDYSYLASFPYFVSYSNHPFDVNEESIITLLQKFFLEAKQQQNITKLVSNHTVFDDLINYLSQNHSATITLDSLEKEFKINKFKLLKNFKKKIGLTPLEYQTAIRIEHSKQFFYTDISLTHIALESGFFDQSHFTHSFKKYVGVTPGQYKRNSNILQDWQ